MAGPWYLDSSQSDNTGDGLSWANAKKDLVNGADGILDGAYAAGETLFISHTHVEAFTADQVVTFPGTITAPNLIYSVDKTGSPEPPDNTDLLIGAKIDCTNRLSINGSFYVYGVTFEAGTNSANNQDFLRIEEESATPEQQRYEDCKLFSLTNDNAADMFLGQTDSANRERVLLEFVNVVFGLGHVGQQLTIRNCNFIWRNKEGLGVAFDTTSSRHANPNLGLFRLQAMAATADLDGLDLSNLSDMDGLFDVGDDQGTPGSYVSNCKLNATFALTTGSRISPARGSTITLVNCDDGDTNYLFEQDSPEGNIVTDTAKTLNATDGTTAFSWKMVSSSRASFEFPLYTSWIPVWVDSTGSKTVTLEFLHDGGVTDLNDDDVFIEVMHALNTADPLYGLVTDRMVPLATPAAQTDSVEGDWTEDLANENAQKAVTASITVNEKGLIYARLALAKPSQTIWVDPDPVVA